MSASAALLIILAIGVGGFFQPLTGLALPLLILTAAVSSRFKRRIFCSRVCPRSRILPYLKPVSRMRSVPGLFHNRKFRQLLCGAVMLCSIMQFVRMVPDLQGFRTLGSFFWILCLVTLTAAVLLGILYKPAAWCTVCPMGTLQDTLSPPSRK